MPYLILVHIGPVQDFIATARRSRDLWFGSWLLSELSKAAAKAVIEEGGRLIFPAPDDPATDLEPETSLNVANKIVALVEKLPTLEKEGDYIQQAIWSRLRCIRRKAYKYVNGVLETKEVAYDQVDDLPEYFWAAVPFDENQDNYVAARAKAEALLAARKTTRDFQPVTWGKNRPKSSLDGIRESVIPENAYPARDELDKVRQKKIDALFSDYGARGAERLSGVDLMKRHGQRGPDSAFPSTSHMASLPLSRRLAQEKGSEALTFAWNNYFVNCIPHDIRKKERVSHLLFPHHPIFGHSDGSLLFESRLADYFEDEEKLKLAKGALRDFLKEAGGGTLITPLPYYALLLADGDGMGKVINSQKTIADHRKFSAILNKFAAQVRQIVEKDHSGALVYAGGDDVLAFLPLHTVLTCAKTLAVTFHEQMKAAGRKDRNGKIPTLSAGVAVSHHLNPLSDALELARRAERKAKAVDGKNALAVSVDMRSGVARTVKGRWGTLDIRLQEFADLHNNEDIPDGAAYELRDAALRLGGDSAIGDDNTLKEILQKEAVRILGRKRGQRGAVEVAKPVLETLHQYILGEPSATGTDTEAAPASVPIEQLADELIIAGLFAKAQAQAGEGPQPQGETP